MTPLSSSVPPEEEPVMNKEASETINRMRAVTISRDYGSGGGEIAARLARRLGWQVVDHAIVERVASELGTSLEEAEAHDESTSGIIAQILTSLQNLYPAYALDAPP
jgi:CMP/dCMP kinase